MKVLVGLGNPGEKYLFTRHNLGFMMIDVFAETLLGSFQKKHNSLIKKTNKEKETLLLVKPQSFMNLSGQPVQDILNFYKLPLSSLLVIQDDKDLPFGLMKFQKSRGYGGHNGIRNIHEVLSSQDYCRLKMGIAGEKFQSQKEYAPSTSDFVLSSFNLEEKKQLSAFLERGLKALDCWITQGFTQASNQFNSAP